MARRRAAALRGRQTSGKRRRGIVQANSRRIVSCLDTFHIPRKRKWRRKHAHIAYLQAQDVLYIMALGRTALRVVLSSVALKQRPLWLLVASSGARRHRFKRGWRWRENSGRIRRGERQAAHLAYHRHQRSNARRDRRKIITAGVVLAARERGSGGSGERSGMAIGA